MVIIIATLRWRPTKITSSPASRGTNILVVLTSILRRTGRQYFLEKTANLIAKLANLIAKLGQWALVSFIRFSLLPFLL